MKGILMIHWNSSDVGGLKVVGGSGGCGGRVDGCTYMGLKRIWIR